MLIFRQGIIFFGRADNVIGRNKFSLTVCKVLTDTTCSHSLLRHDLTELVSCKRDTSLSFMQPRRDHFIYALLAGISIVALDQAPFSIPDHPFFPELTLGGSTRIKDGDSSQIQRLISVTTMGKLHFTDVITKTVGKKIDIFPAQAAFHRPDPVMVRQTEPTVHRQIRLGGRNSLPLQDFPDHSLPGGNRAAIPPGAQIVRGHTSSGRKQFPSHLRSNAGDLAGDRINFDHCDDIVFVHQIVKTVPVTSNHPILPSLPVGRSYPETTDLPYTVPFS